MWSNFKPADKLYAIKGANKSCLHVCVVSLRLHTTISRAKIMYGGGPKSNKPFISQFQESIRKIYPETKRIAGRRSEEAFGQRPESEAAAGVAQGKHGRGGQSHRTARRPSHRPFGRSLTLYTASHPGDVTPPHNRYAACAFRHPPHTRGDDLPGGRGQKKRKATILEICRPSKSHLSVTLTGEFILFSCRVETTDALTKRFCLAIPFNVINGPDADYISVLTSTNILILKSTSKFRWESFCVVGMQQNINRKIQFLIFKLQMKIRFWGYYQNILS